MREDLLQLRRIIRIIPMFPGMKFHADHVPLPQIQINFLMDIGRLGIDERITPNLFWIQLHGFIDKVVLAAIIGTGQTADTGLRDAMAEHVLYELMNVMRIARAGCPQMRMSVEHFQTDHLFFRQASCASCYTFILTCHIKMSIMNT